MSEDIHEGVHEDDEPVPLETYIVSRDFTHSINGASIPFRKGTIVRREDVIRELLGSSAPIVRVLDEADLGLCPHCGLSFSLSAQGGARELLNRARQLMPGYV